MPHAPASLAPDTLPIRMPALSPTMEKGNIVEWKKSVGALGAFAEGAAAH